MRPAPDTLAQIDEMPGEVISFGIGDPRWVMRTQAKLYSDVTTAIIREYSTNAYDAHVMAGHNDPIEVTLPSLMDPFFVVRDHGVGMNMELFRKVYTQFGVSDKRESMDTNGQLGYGSKSGVAYTNQFSVTSVRDGHKISGIIMRRPDWEIVLKVVSNVKTDEPNGTIIKIPVHNVEEFNHKAHEFYKFWLPGRVLINGEPVTHYVGKKITDNLYYSNDWNTSYVVLGNVAYRIANPSALFANIQMNALNFVAYVDDFQTDDGAQPVEFVPSREDLEYSDRTKATLHAIIQEFETKILATAKAEIAAAQTHAEAYERWSEWTSSLGRALFANLEFKGDKFVSDFTISGWRYRPSRSTYTTNKIYDWNVESMRTTMVITNFTPNSVSSDHKRKAKDYRGQMNWTDVSNIIFSDQDGSAVTSPWVDKTRFVDWETLKAALPKKAPKPRTGITYGGRIAGSFDVITKDGYKREQTNLSTTGLLYISVAEDKDYAVSSILKNLNSDATVAVLSKNRINKFHRDHPGVEEFVAWARAQVVIDGSSLLSDDAKTIKNMSSANRNWANRIDPNLVDDPAFAKIREICKNEDALLADYQRNLDLARLCKMWYSVKEYVAVSNTNELADRYPLLTAMRTYDLGEHLYIYLNAAYAAELENKDDE